MTALSELLERYPAQFRSELERALIAEVKRLAVELKDIRELATKLLDAVGKEPGLIYDEDATGDAMAKLAASIRSRKGQP